MSTTPTDFQYIERASIHRNRLRKTSVAARALSRFGSPTFEQVTSSRSASRSSLTQFRSQLIHRDRLSPDTHSFPK